MTATISAWDREDMEPRVKEIIDRTLVRRKTGPYAAKTNGEVIAMLKRLFAAHGYRDVEISGVSRMSGGASKEQFAFRIVHAACPQGERLILRMDPLECIAQTCRGREIQLHHALGTVMPVAPARMVDADGDILGQPGSILEFVSGVTEPSDSKGKGVSGMGSRFDAWAPKLAPQFVNAFVTTHGFDWRTADLSLFAVPQVGTTQAALWQINAWARLWWNALVEPVPMVTYTERWLRENMPVCDKVVVVHCDLRIGNFMFEEPSGKFTAVLDWELGHLGDYHEDISWAIQRLFGTWSDDGKFLVSGLLPRDDFLEQYQRLSGNIIDPVKLRYYEILNAYKCAVMDLGQAIRAAQESNNHQDLVLTWLGSAGSVFLDQMVKLIEEADADAAQH